MAGFHNSHTFLEVVKKKTLLFNLILEQLISPHSPCWTLPYNHLFCFVLLFFHINTIHKKEYFTSPKNLYCTILGKIIIFPYIPVYHTLQWDWEANPFTKITKYWHLIWLCSILKHSHHQFIHLIHVKQVD